MDPRLAADVDAIFASPSGPAPLFSLQAPTWTPSPTMGAVTNLAVSHGSMYVSTSSGKVVRVSVATGEVEDLELPMVQRSSQVQALFADTHSPSALLVALRPTATAYFYKGKGRVVGKAKGMSVTAVAWLRADPSRPDVREVLLGTSTGTIHEIVLEPQHTKHIRQLYALQPTGPLTGLQVEPFPTDGRRLVGLVSTASRLYEFIGGPNLDGLFAEYRERPPLPVEQSGPHDNGPAPAGTGVQLYYRSSGSAQAFCWVTAQEVRHGSLLLSTQRPTDTAIYDAKRFAYPRTLDGSGGRAATATAALPPSPLPLGVVLTEYHYLLLYPAFLVAVSRLDHKPACRALPPAGWPSSSMIGLEHDAGSGSMWVWGSHGVLRVRVVDEDRHAWRQHLEAHNFENALSHCSPTDSSARDAILTAQVRAIVCAVCRPNRECAVCLLPNREWAICQRPNREWAACRPNRGWVVYQLPERCCLYSSTRSDPPALCPPLRAG